MAERPTYEELEQRVRELERSESLGREEKSENALMESERKWRNILINTPQIGISLDPKGRIVFTNKHFLELTGWKEEEILGQDWIECFIPPETRQDIRRVFNQVMGSGSTTGFSTYENEILTRNGERRKVAWSNVLTRDPDGNIVDVTCLGIDLTEHKKAEDRNRYQLGLITSLLHSIPDIVFFKDMKGVYLGCNEEFARYGGIPKESIVGKTDYDLFRRELADVFRANDGKVLESGLPRHNEEWISYPDGRRVLLETLKSPLKDAEGNWIGTLGICRDITKRKQVEEALEREEEKFRALVENTVDWVWQVDASGRYTYVSPQAEKLLGYTSDEILGKTPFDFMSTEEAARIETIFLQAVKNRERILSLEDSLYAKGGNVVVFETNATPLFNPSGKYIGYMGTCRDITERRKAEIALRESEERYRSVLETINDGVILQAASGEILTWNKGAENLFGISREDAVGQKPDDMDWPTIRTDGSRYEGKDHPSMRTLRTGKPLKNEIMGVYQPSGELRWISINTNPVFRGNGTTPYAAAISFSDITALKESEQTLKESQTILRTVVDTSPNCIFVKDSQGRYVLVNRAISALYQSSPHEMIGKTDHDLAGLGRLSRSQAEAFSQDDLEVIQTKTLKVVPAEPLSGKDGKTHWFHTFKVPISLPNHADCMLGIATDITKVKEAEQAMREHEVEKTTILDHQSNIVILQDLECRVLWINRAGCESAGLPLDSIVGEHCCETWNYCDSISPDCPVKRAIDTGYAQEVTKKTRDGKIWQIKGIPIRDNQGKIVRAMEVIEDVTERYSMEERLRQSQKMEAIGTLAGGIAHDFNNILGIIVGNTELAMFDLPEWNPAQESLKEIREASLRARDLVNQILLFARQKEHKISTIRLGPIVKECLKMLRASIPTMVEIRSRIDENIPAVAADPSQIQQIIMNLSTNAGQAMESEGGILDIIMDSVTLDEPLATVAGTLPQGSYVRLQVRDNGSGISSEDIEHVFDPFFTTKGIGEGTGLGLAVVHGIVQDRNGGILVESAEGEGTSFIVYLPASEEDSVEEEAPRESVLPRGSARVLFVDDEAMIRKLGRRMLERQGYEVETRASGLDALERFEQDPERFDLVVTDMSMPGLRGDKLAAEMLKIRPGIPVVLCTGFSNQISEEKARELGIRAFVMKPLTAQELANTVRQVLDESGSPPQAFQK